MRAISLWQPWASAVALGSKTIETRHWPTKYRGSLAIHAAKRRPVGELIYLNSVYHWRGTMMSLLGYIGNGKSLVDDLPFGAIVATCELVDCKPTDDFTVSEIMSPRRPEGRTDDLYNWTEADMGDFSIGRFGWVFANIRALETPIPFTGRQGFFNVPDELIPKRKGAA